MYWRCFRLVDHKWCDLAGMRLLSVDEVDLANLAIDAAEDARIRARKKP